MKNQISTACELKLADLICRENFDEKRFARISEALLRRIARRERRLREEEQDQIMQLHARSGKFGGFTNVN